MPVLEAFRYEFPFLGVEAREGVGDGVHDSFLAVINASIETFALREREAPPLFDVREEATEGGDLVRYPC